MDKHIRILHLISSLDVGGAEQNLFRLITTMDKGFYENIVVCMTSSGIISHEMEEFGILVHSLRMRKGVPDLRAVLRLRFLANLFRPDIIQCWMYHAGLLGLTLLKPSRTLWNIRCSDMDLTRYGIVYSLTVKIGAWLAGIPYTVIVNSYSGKAVHEKLGYHPKEWFVIPNGFNTEIFKPDRQARKQLRAELNIPEDAFVIGLVCRFDPMKDHATFFQAAIAFQTSHPEAHFILAGRGVSRDTPYLRDLLPQGVEDGRYHLLDERRDVKRIFASLDTSTSSSAWGEGFPNVIGEAMACGIPCVGTDVGDTGILMGDTGILVNRQSPQELCKAWEVMARMTPEERSAMGSRARERIRQHFSQDKTTRSYEDLYRHIVKADFS